MTSSRIFRPVSGPNPARKNSAKNAPVLCQVRHAPGHSLFSFCVKKGLQNGPYSQLHFCTQNASLASPIPAYRLHIADIPPTRSSPTAILIYPAPLYTSAIAASPSLSSPDSGQTPPVRTHGGSAPQERRHGVHPQSHAYSPRPEGRPPLRPIPAPAHPATCPLPNTSCRISEIRHADRI